MNEYRIATWSASLSLPAELSSAPVLVVADLAVFGSWASIVEHWRRVVRRSDQSTVSLLTLEMQVMVLVDLSYMQCGTL